MAITATASTASGGNQTAAATIAMTVAGANVAIGDLIVVYVAADNAGTSGVSSISSVTDSGGNTYTSVKTQNTTIGAINDGCTNRIFASAATVALTSGSSTITVNFSPNTTAKAVAYRVFSGVGVLSGTPTSGTGQSAAYDSTAQASVQSGQLVVAACANESVTPPAADADTTGGAWLGGTAISGGSGSDATKMSLRWAYKIVNATGTQQFDGATGVSTDWAACIAVYTAAAVVVTAFTSKARVAWS